MTLAHIRRRRRATIAQAMAAATLAILILTPRMDQGATENQEPAAEAVLATAPDQPNPT